MNNPLSTTIEEIKNTIEVFPSCKEDCLYYRSERHQLGTFTKRCGLNIQEYEESCPKTKWKNDLKQELEERKEIWESYFKYKYRLKENPARVTIKELLRKGMK